MIRCTQMFIVLMVLLPGPAIGLGSRSASSAGSSIEITEVKNIGVSAANETRSVIQVRWTHQLAPGASAKAFEVSLEVRYADGATEKSKVSANGSATTARVEVPTLHFSAGRPGAEMRSFIATMTATYNESATKQGTF